MKGSQLLAKFFVFLTIILVGIFAHNTQTFAAQIKKVKGSKVSIQLSKRDRMKAGETWEVLSNKGKRVGLVKILSVKKRMATGKKMKGKVAAKLWLKNSVQSRKSIEKDGSKSNSKPEPEDMASIDSDSFFGGLIGLSNNSIEITQTDDSKIEYTGSSFSVAGFFDYPMYDWLWVRGILGYQTFLAESADDDRKIETGYLQIGALGRYAFSKSSWRPWLGGFVYASIPMTKIEEEADSAVTPDSITTTSFFGLAFGLDIVMGKRAVIPIQFEYGFFPPSDDANATGINIKIGYGVAW